MRRLLVPAALVLALLTGAVLAATRLVALSPAVALDAAPQTGASAAVVRRFYAAVNATLATGDDAPLASLLAPDFVDHAPQPGASSDPAGLLGAVATLRAVAPGLRLAVRDLVAQGDRVAVRVEAEGGAGAAFLGSPVEPEQLWGTNDLFRVAGGQVVERWGDPTGLASFTPLAAVAVPVDRPSLKAVTLERWTYAPGAAKDRVTDTDFLVLLSEAGQATVRLEARVAGAAAVAGGKRGTAGQGGAPTVGTGRVLDPGDVLVIPYGWRFTLANEGGTRRPCSPWSRPC
jgi:predicted ester cyclase